MSEEIYQLIKERDILLEACIKANKYLAYLASEGKINDQNEETNWAEVQQSLANAIIKNL